MIGTNQGTAFTVSNTSASERCCYCISVLNQPVLQIRRQQSRKAVAQAGGQWAVVHLLEGYQVSGLPLGFHQIVCPPG